MKNYKLWTSYTTVYIIVFVVVVIIIVTMTTTSKYASKIGFYVYKLLSSFIHSRLRILTSRIRISSSMKSLRCTKGVRVAQAQNFLFNYVSKF